MQLCLCNKFSQVWWSRVGDGWSVYVEQSLEEFATVFLIELLDFSARDIIWVILEV